MARETKLTPKVQRKILAHLRAGAYMTHAARAAGVEIRRMQKWLDRGAKTDDEPYATFAADVERVRAEVAVKAIKAISKAEQGGDWKAAAWKLERMFPKLYGSRSTHEIEAGVSIKAELIPRLREYYAMHGLDSGPAKAELTPDAERDDEPE